jgi:ElaB/YqjD/DUF883 family membrane-anchored ribosome-binding protein
MQTPEQQVQTTEQRIESEAERGSDATVQALLNDVDEFLSYIAIVKTPDVDAIRDRLERSLSSAKLELLTAVKRSRSNSPGFYRASGLRARKFISTHPGIAIAAAAVLGAVIGTVAGASRHRAR